jgi:chromosomal replication initiation ATPase DnaA
MNDRRLTPADILAAVCHTTEVSHDELTGGQHHRGTRHRTDRVVAARQAAVYLLRERTDLSYPQIAALFGRPTTSHSTMHGRYEAARWAMKRGDVEFVNLIDAVVEELGGKR